MVTFSSALFFATGIVKTRNAFEKKQTWKNKPTAGHLLDILFCFALTSNDKTHELRRSADFQRKVIFSFDNWKIVVEFVLELSWRNLELLQEIELINKECK
jgi:hypothetical protein